MSLFYVSSFKLEHVSLKLMFWLNYFGNPLKKWQLKTQIALLKSGLILEFLLLGSLEVVTTKAG